MSSIKISMKAALAEIKAIKAEETLRKSKISNIIAYNAFKESEETVRELRDELEITKERNRELEDDLESIDNFMTELGKEVDRTMDNIISKAETMKDDLDNLKLENERLEDENDALQIKMISIYNSDMIIKLFDS